MRKLAALVALSASMMFVLSALAPRASGDFADPEQVVKVDVVFPPSNLTYIENATDLALYLLQSLGLPPALNGTIVNHGILYCCLVNWNHRRVPMENRTDILFNSSDGQVLVFDYWGSGRLAMAQVHRPFGDVLPNASLPLMIERVEMYASEFGITSFPYDRFFINSTVQVPTTEVVLYSNYSGLPLAFGNELRVTFDLERKQAIKLIFYPWFSAPTPSMTFTQAAEIAIDFFNESGIEMRSNLTYMDTDLAFDSYHYSLTYQVETKYRFDITYPTVDVTFHYEDEYRVWVDPYSGTVTYWVGVPEHWGPPPPVSSPGIWFPILILVVSAILIALAIVYREPVSVAMLSVILLPYARLRKESALEHFVRGQLYAYIVLNPGASYSVIRDAFSLSNGTTTYHLLVLMSLGYVKSLREGKNKRFFPVSFDSGKLGRKITNFQERILYAVKRLGSASPSEVAREISASRQRSAYNLRKMLEYGLIEKDPQCSGKYRAVVVSHETIETNHVAP